MTYEILDEITRADLAISFKGSEPGEIFVDAVNAFLCETVDIPETVRRIENIDVALHRETLDLLLFSLFEELIFIRDTRQLLLHPAGITLNFTEGMWTLLIRLSGEKIDRTRHSLKNDIKAVTLHKLDFSDDGTGRWNAMVVLDL